MDFKLSKEQIELKDSIKDFLKKEIESEITKYYLTGEFPRELYRKLGSFNLPTGGTLLCPTIPKEYGGAAMDSITSGIITEEVGRSSGLLLSYLFETTSHLLLNAQEHIKKKIIPSLCNAENIVAVALTERDSGSYPADMRTRATKKGDFYVINGEKHYITFATVADYIIVCAKTLPEAGSKGISCFLVNAEAPGIKRFPIKNAFSHRLGGWGIIVFKDVEVPSENIIGQENRGLSMFLETWNYDRVLASLLCIGMAEASLDDAIKHMKRNQKLINSQYLQFLVAEDAALLEAAKLMAYKALWLRDQKVDFRKEAAMAKLFGVEVSQKIIDDTIQILGARGLISGLPEERRLREVRAFRLAGGSSEIMKLTIARELFK